MLVRGECQVNDAQTMIEGGLRVPKGSNDPGGKLPQLGQSRYAPQKQEPGAASRPHAINSIRYVPFAIARRPGGIVGDRGGQRTGELCSIDEDQGLLTCPCFSFERERAGAHEVASGRTFVLQGSIQLAHRSRPHRSLVPLALGDGRAAVRVRHPEINAAVAATTDALYGVPE